MSHEKSQRPLAGIKVLYLIDAQGGGAVSHVMDLAEGLRRHGMEPEILFFSGGPSVEEARRRKIPVHRIRKKGSGLVFLVRLYLYLRRKRFDMLHTHTLNGNFFGRVAGRAAGVPVLLTTVHSHIIDELKGLKEPSAGDRFRYWMDLFLSRWSRTLIVVSEAIRDRLIGHGIPTRKIVVIENGVDTERFRPEPRVGLSVREELGIPGDVKVVGIIGRLVPLKNHDLFLRAAHSVSKKRDDVRFLVVGDGPLMGPLQETARRLGFEDRVIFTGWRTDMEKILQAIDILVLCSQVEGHNVAILEAMACEKPVVGTDVRGIQTTVKQGETGLLVPLGDPEALAGGVLDLLADPFKTARLGKSGRRYVEERYSRERMISAYVELYQGSGAAHEA